MYAILVLLVLFLSTGLLLIAESALLHDRSFRGRKTLRKMGKWQSENRNLWDTPILQKLCTFASRFVYLEQTAEEKLRRDLSRAGYAVSPQMFTARKYAILAFGILGTILCVLLRFWFGLILMAEAYVTLTTSVGGQGLFLLLLAAVIYSVLRALKINTPLMR